MDFYRSLSEHYDEIFPLKEQQKRFLHDYVTKEKLESVLDIGCGTGTFALEISRMGLHVLGVDLSEEMIGISKKKAQESGGDASFAVADMGDLSKIETEFAGVLCLGNTLAHVSGETELKDVLIEFLKKGTHLLVQTVNYDRMLAARIREFPVIKTPHLTFYRYYDYRSDGKIDFSMKIEFPDTKEIVSGVNILFPIPSAVLKKALLEAGWEISGVWGNYEGAPWTEDSPATIIAAKRKLVKK
ncbi:methyltransferase [Desulfosporosinus sp. HMP52]|uniref:class I SAM-dependent methyltransferase n=1 Tax=Desulfosporosinus sp. HMP52 TaxID=1487923 RepID=UPI00051FCC98|nr:class I SAM-dependent methyltransferase [Desulfosporosinus sp. HMP52]KGK89794.1 methyltransferase [Desulfosporosinus sp. HMP52]